tara:strand:+ start:778 stop:1383 length:606 start_codon:yes stop_codon:yes gene_type:complete
MAYTIKKYSPTEIIPIGLPSNYRLGNENKNCQNCIFFSDRYCEYWDELVKGDYLCDKWMTNTVDVPDDEIINNVPTICNLYYGGGEVRVSSDGSVAILEISYGGQITQLNNRLPDGWEIKHNTRKILIYNLWGLSISTETEIFTYRGRFKPFMATLLDWDGNKLSAAINTENVHYWEILGNSLWEDYDNVWEDYGNTYLVT